MPVPRLVGRLAGRTLNLAFGMFYLYLLTPFLVPVARTWRGRVYGLLTASATLFVLALAGMISDRLPRAWQFPAVLATAGAAFGAMVVLVAHSPRPYQHPAEGLFSIGRFVPITRPTLWQRIGPFMPETDLVRLATALGTRFDPRLSRREARAIREVTGRILDEMDADQAYAELFPVGEMCLYSFGRGSYLAYHFLASLPPNRGPGERLGALVFLHGHGGNFQILLHTWRPFADRHRFAVVCPTFGYGNWEHPDGVETVRWVLDTVVNFPNTIDPSRVYLAGLSQGGCGVGRGGAAFADRLAGLVFLSPTMEPDVLNSPAFVNGWRGRPVLVVQGGRDHHVKPPRVTAAVDLMRANGADVTYHLDPDETHFQFFAKRDEIQDRVAEWMVRPAG